MDGRQKPDAQPENENDSSNKEIIDLTQVVQGEDDDGIIDLTTIMGDPGQVTDESGDEIIDLAGMEQTDATVTDALDEEIIDLENAISADEPIDFAQDTDEEIIDLTEMETTLETHPAEPDLAVPEADEDIVDLLEAVEPAPAAVEADLEKRVDRGETMPTDPSDSVDDEIDPVAAEPISLTEAQLESALERTIEKIYAEKIEQLMIQTIEKTVNKEIEKIKQALMEDGDGTSG